MLNTKFWTDPYILDLDPSEKLLYVYLITNPYTDICGIYEIATKIIAVETGFEKDTIERILKRFERDGKIMYKNGWVALRNFAKNQSKNPKVEIGMRVGIEKAPKELKEFVSMIGYDTPMHLNPNLDLDFDLKNYTSPVEKDSKKTTKKKEVKKTANYIAIEENLKKLIEKGEFEKEIYNFPIKGIYDWRFLINHGKGLTPVNFYMAIGCRLKTELTDRIFVYESDTKEGFMSLINGKDWANIKKIVDVVKYKDFKGLLEFTNSEAWDDKRNEYKWNWDFGTCVKYLAKFNGQNDNG